jgi:uncharacterized protein YdeI (YjbR/CyaY-like superfamily)
MELCETDFDKQLQGIWLKIAKKDSTIMTVSYPEAIEGALCFGWIDGQKKSYDQEVWLQKFTPRRPKSVWSKVNVDKVMKLIESGRMKPTGMQEVNVAKEDGRWDAAYESQRNFGIPDDFQKELDRNERAKDFFKRSTDKIDMRYALESRPPRKQERDKRESKSLSRCLTTMKNFIHS